MRHLFHRLRGGDECRRFAHGPFGRGSFGGGPFGGEEDEQRRHGHGSWWGGDHHDGRRGMRGGGRGGRMFEQGDLRFLILSLIAERPRYGYDIIKAIGDKVGGGYSPSPGVVYPTLTLLEEMGLTSVTTGDGAKKLHTITEEGRAHLADNADALALIEARLEKLSALHGWEPPAAIVRAMENLKMALRLRLKARDGAPLTPEQVRAVADALDAAARAVEQS